MKPRRPETGRRRNQGAFTFAEVLAALLFMAIVIPAAMQGLQIANRAGVVAHRKSVAVQLAESRLNEMLVTGDWQGTTQSGYFDGQYRDYQWRLLNESWPEDAMRLVTLEVTYKVQNQDYYVRLSTLMKESNL